MFSRKTTLGLLLAFVVPSLLLVSLQEDFTDRTAPNDEILPGYFAGDDLRDILGTAPVSIVQARCLVRGVLTLCTWVGGSHLEAHNRAVQFASVWGALCLIYAAGARVLSPAKACAAVLLAAGFVPWGFLSISYSVSWPYDLPSLFFAALGMWAILSRRFVGFALSLVLGTLNKETIVFLLPAYLLAEWPALPWKTLLVRGLILAVLFVAAYELPRMILQGHGSPVVTVSASDYDTPRWRTNVQSLLFKNRGTAFENVYWALSLHLLPLVGWRALPRSLRAIYLAAPALLVPIFLYGNIHELRLYNELIPLGALATVLVVSRKLDASAAVVSEPTVP